MTLTKDKKYINTKEKIKYKRWKKSGDLDFLAFSFVSKQVVKEMNLW